MSFGQAAAKGSKVAIRAAEEAARQAAAARNALLPSASISTDRLDPVRAFDLWCRSVLPYRIELGVPAREFQLETSGWMLGPFILTTGRIRQMRTVRSASLLGDRYSDMLFVLANEGRMSGQTAARRVGIGPGDFAVFDARQPFEMEAEDCSYLMLLLPRESLYGVSEGRLADLHGASPKGRCVDFLADHVRLLARHLPGMTIAEAKLLAQSTLKLVEGVLHETSDDPDDTGARVTSLHRRVGRYIEDHLAASDLSPERIAADLEISRTQLYRAFQSSGGVAQHIRARRLDTARTLLAHPEEHRPLGEIAELLGFATTAAFAKAFRSRFGMPPRTARRATTMLAAPNSQAMFDHWTRSIASFADLA